MAAVSALRQLTNGPEPTLSPVESAKAAGLRYVHDAGPGIRRKRAGKSFSYVGPDGLPIRDEEHLARIKSLAIPPAWSDVWICPSLRGHLQATGRDARGRKQYRYHPRWRAVRDETKYERMIGFAEALPLIRERVDADLAQPGLTRRKLLATIVRLLETTLIRVGNQEYARQNQSFGLTTLRERHVKVNGSELRFKFRGKSGKSHQIAITDRRLARVVKRCQDLPGQTLFQYETEDGDYEAIDSEDVNEYLREITAQDFTAKDFRTWAGTVLTARALRDSTPFDSQAEARGNVVRAIETVAERLGNTAAVCRRCYVHPAVLEAYLDESLPAAFHPPIERTPPSTPGRLSADEAAVLTLLRQRLLQESAESGKNGRG